MRLVAWGGALALVAWGSSVGAAPARAAAAGGPAAFLVHTKQEVPLGLSYRGRRLALGGPIRAWAQALGPAAGREPLPGGLVAWTYPGLGLRVVVKQDRTQGFGLVLNGQVVSGPPQRGRSPALPQVLRHFRPASFVTDLGLGPTSTLAAVKAAMGPTQFEDQAHLEKMHQLHFGHPFEGRPQGGRILFRYVDQKLVELVLTRW